jgi:NADPH2:quinone reductase
MLAAFILATGPCEIIRIGDLPRPVPREHQVLVRTGAVAVNPIDTYVRAGTVKFPLPEPFIIGCDVAGTVESTGAAVTRFREGDRVWGSNQGLFGRQGTFAEFCAIDEDWLYPTPSGVSDESAAAGALVGITAQLGLFLHAGLQPGERLFVHGGSGGVGSAVVQLASAAGAVVVTTAGSPEKADLCRQFGAREVIQYRSEDLDRRLSAWCDNNGPFHVWFETLRMPVLERTIPLMARRGRIVLMAGRESRPEFPIGPFYVKDLRAIGFAMFNASIDEQREAATQLNQRLTEHRWKPAIGVVMPLAAAAAAHKLQEQKTIEGTSGTPGKIVLKP